MSGFVSCKTPEEAVDRLSAEYARSVAALRGALERFAREGHAPAPVERASGAFVYPELRIIYRGARLPLPPPRAFARLQGPGTYAVTVTRPDLFRPYLLEQLRPLITDYKVEIEVGRSSREIAYPYILDGGPAIDLKGAAPADLAAHFPTTNLSHIGDELCDGLHVQDRSEPLPLSLFDGPRTDFSLARLRHYTGTPTEHFQKYILFTNYHRYVDEIVRFASENLKAGVYEAVSCAGGVMVTRETPDVSQAVHDSAWRRHQMPAYHLMAQGRGGISLVNIGVGPSNAKTITDHLAVLRPEAWLMIGHCGGLRPSQTIGDYVLAHAYLRDDNVLNEVLSPEIPIPPIAEIQQALQEAAARVTGESGDGLKRRLRTGTVVTTDDRNWELRYTASAKRFNQSRAVAIDMESATIAAQGYRFRVPYGTLLCVSDKPLHGEIKMPGQANQFYERAVSEHIRIGIAAVDALKTAGERLHSRKLRAFDEPPFR